MTAAAQPIRVLIVEDNADDAELIRRVLGRGGPAVETGHAETYAAAEAALMASSWDCVLSDYNIPGTSLTDIIDLARAADPDLPVIVVSGSVGEETAVSLMRAGASDLILKSNLSRLTAALSREVKAAEESHARRESEDRFRDIVLATADWVWETDADHRLSYELAGRELAEWSDPLRAVGRTHWEAVGADPAAAPEWREHRRVLDAHLPFRDFRFGFRSPTGQQYHVSLSGRPAFDRAGVFAGYRGTATDETAMVGYYQRAEAAEAMLGSLLDVLSRPAILFDVHDRLVAASAPCRRIVPPSLLLAGTALAAVRPTLDRIAGGAGVAAEGLADGCTLVSWPEPIHRTA